MQRGAFPGSEPVLVLPRVREFSLGVSLSGIKVKEEREVSAKEERGELSAF